MNNALKFYIEGQWLEAESGETLEVVDPSTEQAFIKIAVGNAEDVNKAVAAARRAFPAFSVTSVGERLALLEEILRVYNLRYDDLVQAVSQEMGAPLHFARDAQVWSGRAHLESTISALKSFTFSEQYGTTRVVREAIGVCALITPWNWPLNQIVCKVAPAIAAGCTVVLKPSEIAPLTGIIFAEILHEAGVPAGVFNLVNGTGPDVGQPMSSHPQVDMVSFTGSTRAGIMVAKSAADTVKRVAQELGGKSANILLEDADFEVAVAKGVQGCFSNSGQSCDAPTRMLVPAAQHARALEIAKRTAQQLVTGSPRDANTNLGPVISAAQFDKIQGLIQAGIEEGATLVAGGLGRPEGLDKGYYVRPTIFGNVQPSMTIAREEIFGPVLSILPYDSEEQAIEIANDTVYGLAAYVQSTHLEHARTVAGRMRAGSVYLNYPDWDTFAPFGGYKQSGNGREYAGWGIHDFLEIKGVVGWGN
ncbi:aldehyde dehydrogenase family protein [Pseudomonas helleri]|uniref:Aldehyde dehydrogenase family protein n=1 Tax=Pseudomonas helleri TaxID=1608996 RepID=A0A6A7YC57_9PSED|nr:aldehyde dehydrogenase family protein [Pseudomonas helleri]MQT30239.1 aldehyde dehydrogenase family protein [Pseudomonas helleri]MQT46864.1 aldehyde dehydrogenase family protein [Pseudomonas helleri]MQT87827.1 aldehyde dehydrogenase family protein [Pseudomonas helleri]